MLIVKWNTQTGVHNDRVCGSLTYVINGEIKEHRIQDNMAACLRGKREAERTFSESVSYKCYKGKAETEIYMGEKSIKALILEWKYIQK